MKENQINSYLTFRIGEEKYAANVSKVLNILEMTPITKVPRAPDYMLGVINLRGSVLPVIDTRIKFGIDELRITSNTCIIVCELDIHNEKINIGAVVDGVLAVIEPDASQLQDPPSIGDEYKADFIQSVIKENDEFIMLLDMEQIFTTNEISSLKEIHQSLKMNE